jgi:predicted dehydrogenase
VGFIGFGHQAAEQHAGCLVRNYADKIQVVAIGDVLVSQVPAVRAQLHQLGWDGAALYTTPDERSGDADDLQNISELFANHPNLDVVIVSTPSAKHFYQVEACLRAGAHVLVDKPLALTYEHGRHLTALAAIQKRHLVVCSQRRYEAVYQYAKATIARGELGRLLSINCTISHEDWREAWRLNPALAGGGVIWDFGWHVIDTILYLVDGAVVAVDASLHVPADALTETHAALLLHFRDGPPACVTINGGAPKGSVYESLQIWGSGGILFLQRHKPVYDTIPPSVTHQLQDGTLLQPDLTGATGQRWAPTDAFFRFLTTHDAADQADHDLPSAGFKSLDTIRVIEGAYASAHKGRRIVLKAGTRVRRTPQPLLAHVSSR